MLPVLETRTTKGVERTEVNRGEGGPTEPTPLVFTVTARHMVASRYLLYYGFTLLASLDVTGLNNPILTSDHSFI